MAFPLSNYSQVKDKYCIVYLGSEKLFVTQLKTARRLLENAYHPLSIYLCCADKFMSLLQDEDKTITLQELESKRKNFGYIREIKWDTINNPVEDLLLESGVHWKK